MLYLRIAILIVVTVSFLITLFAGKKVPSARLHIAFYLCWQIYVIGLHIYILFFSSDALIVNTLSASLQMAAAMGLACSSLIFLKTRENDG